jgi:hypothetical protein
MSGGITSKPWLRWTLVVIVVASLLALTVLPWYMWGKPETNSESRQKAQELYDLATQSGMNVPSVDTLEQIYGTDGGYAAETAEGYLRESALLYTNVNTGEVLQRPTIAQAKYLGYSLLVMKVYRPDFYWDKALPFISDLKVQHEDEYPTWLKDDLAQLK